MERSGAISPGILVLTTGLSKPFRRLDKYSAMLQELERYTEKNHPDRGDTQRSVAVYREIAVSPSISFIRMKRNIGFSRLSSFENAHVFSLSRNHIGSMRVHSKATRVGTSGVN